MDSVSHFYSQPSHLSLGGYPVFAGSRRQVGGNIFGSIARFTLPLLKNFGRKVGLPLLKTVGRQALGVAANVAADALQGKNAKEALKSHAREAALDTLRSLPIGSAGASTSYASRRSRGVRTKRRKQKGGGVRSGRVGRSRRRRRRRPGQQRKRSISKSVRKTQKTRKRSRKRPRSTSQATKQKSKRRRTLTSYL